MDGSLRFVRREHLATACHTDGPVREAICWVMRTHDQPRANDEGAFLVDALYDLFTQCLKRTIRLARDLFYSLILNFCNRSRFVNAHLTDIFINRNGRDKHVLRHAVLQSLSGETNKARKVPCNVDHCIPDPALELIYILFPVPKDGLHMRKQSRIGFAAIEQRNFVIIPQCCFHQMPPCKTCTTDNQDSHLYLSYSSLRGRRRSRRSSGAARSNLTHHTGDCFSKTRNDGDTYFFTLVNLASVALASPPSGRML